MSSWFPAILTLLAVLAGIVLTHALFLYAQFYRESQGYMLRAARRIWPYLVVFFTVDWLIGSLFVFLMYDVFRSSSGSPLLPAPITGVITGSVVAAIPIIVEARLLPKNGVTVERLQGNLVKSLLRLNLVLRYNFAWAIETLRQQDVFDSQTSDAWGLNIPPQQLGRRLRILYEIYKFEIAERRGDPSFLYFHDNRTPWDMFYLLVRHLGRKRLRQSLKNPPPSPSPDWDGRERRRVRGTRADRLYPGSPRSRSYDDPALIEKVLGRPPAPPDAEDSEQERQSYRALAATWPAGPTILQILNEEPKKADDLQRLLPEDDVPAVLFVLEAANLIKARADEIQSQEQRRRFSRVLKSLWPGPAILRIVNTQPEWVNTSKYVLPSDGVSAVLFSRLRANGPETSRSKNQQIDFTDFYFELSEVGKGMLDKLLSSPSTETEA